MSWNLFEIIINALKPSKECEQPSDVQQSWPEGGTEQLEGSQEQSESYQEPAGVPQQDDWQD